MRNATRNHITIAAIGKSTQSPEEVLTAKYLGRLPWKIDLKIHDGRSLKNKTEQTAWLLKQVSHAEHVIVLDEHGKQHTSEAFAGMLASYQQQGMSHLAFVIGGADGLDSTQIPKHFERLAFGSMTWPHLIVRALLAEQLYRAYTIHSKHPYHRA